MRSLPTTTTCIDHHSALCSFVRRRLRDVIVDDVIVADVILSRRQHVVVVVVVDGSPSDGGRREPGAVPGRQRRHGAVQFRLRPRPILRHRVRRCGIETTKLWPPARRRGHQLSDRWTRPRRSFARPKLRLRPRQNRRRQDRETEVMIFRPVWSGEFKISGPCPVQSGYRPRADVAGQFIALSVQIWVSSEWTRAAGGCHWSLEAPAGRTIVVAWKVALGGWTTTAADAAATRHGDATLYLAACY